MLLLLLGRKGATASNSWPAVQSSLEGKMGERKSAVLDILSLCLRITKTDNRHTGPHLPTPLPNGSNRVDGDKDNSGLQKTHEKGICCATGHADRPSHWGGG